MVDGYKGSVVRIETACCQSLNIFFLRATQRRGLRQTSLNDSSAIFASGTVALQPDEGCLQPSCSANVTIYASNAYKNNVC